MGEKIIGESQHFKAVLGVVAMVKVDPKVGDVDVIQDLTPKRTVTVHGNRTMLTSTWRKNYTHKENVVN